MAIDILTLSLARSYTKASLNGLGALKGASCTVKDITTTTTGSIVTFEWTGNDGSIQTSQLNIENGTDGKDGSSVTNLEVRQVGTDYHLFCTITDSDGNEQEIDAGILPSVGGANITTDTTPTQGSTNPVESGGVFDALELKQDKLTGNDGQLVGFDAQGNAIAVDAPETGVTEFNGRKGVVLPEIGDYTADMVGADPVGSAAQALVDANTYTDEKIAEVNADLEAHVQDTDIHITADERVKWDEVSNEAVRYDDSRNVHFEKLVVLDTNQKLLGKTPDGDNHVLAGTLAWNIGTPDEYVQNEFGSGHVHMNLNSKDRPTVELPGGVKKEVAYTDDVSLPDGGVTGQVLAKKTDLDGEVEWVDVDIAPIEISKADYELIPEADRKDKVYYVHDEDSDVFKYSDQRPTTNDAKMGDIVFNSLPEPNGFVGWVYTAFGWLGFGVIEGTKVVEYILNDMTTFMVDDGTGTGNGTPFLYRDTIG